MSEPPVPARWKVKLDLAKAMLFSGSMFLLIGLFLLLPYLFSDTSLGLVLAPISIGYILRIAGSLSAEKARLIAYREILPQEQRVERIAKIIGIPAHRAAREIARHIQHGKLDGFYVDNDKGVVELHLREEPKRQASAAAPPQIILSVFCPGCGAMTKVSRGQSVECEYCGAVVLGE
jgi:VIT1/CCC1 family predicted Fe2+/Mn2+ transporter